MENRSLKRVLDFKLVYDCLAEASSGRVRLDALLSHWPADLLALSKLPRDCEAFWRQSATEDGLVDWDGFSGGLEKALKADEKRLARGELPSQAEQSLRSLQTVASRPVAQVTSGEIERFLSSCRAGSLVKALARAGRDMHRWQVSIHKQNAAAAEKGSADSKPEPAPAAEKGRKDRRRSSSSSLLAGREKEELVRGVEVLESTQRWFQSRLAELSLEDQQRATGSEQMRAEDLLQELESEEDESQALQHLRVINTHLSSLALTADSQPLPSPSLVPSEQPSRPAHPIAVVEFPRRKTRPLRSVPNMTSRPAPLGLGPGIQRSVSVPAGHRQRTATLESSNQASLPPPAPRRKPHRSSSFNDKNKGALGGKPVRAASSMSTLVQQYTDYPGHHPQPSPLLPRPIRHTSSVQSLPVHYQQTYPPPPKNAPPAAPFSLPPSRSHSTQSLTQASHRASSGMPSHQFVSEVL